MRLLSRILGLAMIPALCASVTHVMSTASANAAEKTAAKGDFVCVRKWGIRRNEGYCGRVMELKPDRQEIVIRVTGGDGTAWRTKGTVCSEGLNIKRLRLGQTLQVPLSCLE